MHRVNFKFFTFTALFPMALPLLLTGCGSDSADTPRTIITMQRSGSRYEPVPGGQVLAGQIVAASDTENGVGMSGAVDQPRGFTNSSPESPPR